MAAVPVEAKQKEDRIDADIRELHNAVYGYFVSSILHAEELVKVRSGKDGR